MGGAALAFARRMLRHRWLFSSLFVIVVVACGGRAASVADGTPNGGGAGSGAKTGSDNGGGDGVTVGGGNNDHEQDDLKDASHVDANVDTSCGDQVCHHGDACVITTSGGGPCMLPDDAGLCPDGKPADGACCNRMTTTYECKPVPAKCAGTLACPCAESLCQCGGCSLGGAPNTLSCGCFYP